MCTLKIEVEKAQLKDEFSLNGTKMRHQLMVTPKWYSFGDPMCLTLRESK